MLTHTGDRNTVKALLLCEREADLLGLYREADSLGASLDTPCWSCRQTVMLTLVGET